MKKVFSFESSNGNLASEKNRAQRAIDKQPSAKISAKTFLCGQQIKRAWRNAKSMRGVRGSARGAAGEVIGNVFSSGKMTGLRKSDG